MSLRLRLALFIALAIALALLVQGFWGTPASSACRWATSSAT